MPQVQINATEFDRAFQEALPQHAKEVDAEMAASPLTASMGGGPMTLVNLGAITGTFCAVWPKIETGINKALWFYSWVDKDTTALIRAWVAAFKSKFLPTVCPKPE